MRGKIKIVAGALVLGEDNPVTGESPGPRAFEVPICELVGEDARPDVRILALFVGNTRDHLVQVSIALPTRDAPSLTNVSEHVARGEEMLMPEWMQGRVSELAGRLGYWSAALRLLARQLRRGRMARHPWLW